VDLGLAAARLGTAGGADVLNRDLWEDPLHLVTARGEASIEWHYVRGHVGTPGNERCDEIAVPLTRVGRGFADGAIGGYPLTRSSTCPIRRSRHGHRRRRRWLLRRLTRIPI
jgi:hypothetical protein